MGYYAGKGRGHAFLPRVGLDLAKVRSLKGLTGESNYAGGGSGLVDGYISVGQRNAPKYLLGAGGFAGVQTHLQQNILMSGAKNTLIGFYATVTHGNVTSTNGEILGADLYARNPGTGIMISAYGQRIMFYGASGSKTKYKKGVLIDILDMATSHVSGGGTQGICIQLNPTSIVNNQVDAILINQNSAQTIASGIVFKGKMGASNGNHAVINFVGSGDQNQDEGNKQILLKFRTAGDTYTVTPAELLAALGQGNITQL